MNPHYDIPNLTLTDEYLTDPILLALSWKRAHGYVRSLNWYANNFELDAPSLFLQENCKAWTDDLRGKRVDLKQLELVPAPKANRWGFVKPVHGKEEETEDKSCLIWQPADGEVLSLRPLAHIGIKEQTYFTLLMSCLANTVQGAICYDATDIKLSADLADKSNAFIVSALNKDINTFDSMVEALHYHMYQPVVLVNTGELGGSYVMAPYKDHHDKHIAHNTGKNQISISSFKLNMFDFRRDELGTSAKSGLKIKAEPAGLVS